MIIWFSGTGNSRLAAQSLGRELGEQCVKMADYDPRESAGESRVIWVFPIYSWGVPPVVRRFIAKAEMPAGATHHMVCTCGDDTGLADGMWRRDLGRRGWETGGAWSVIMPNTYVTMRGFDVDSREVAEAKLGAMCGRIRAIAEAIASGSRETDLTRGAMAWLKTRVIYPWFIRHAMSPRPFKALKGCIGCGRCVVSCPTGNIKLDSAKRPVWGDDCAFCLGCYHVCPRHAVAYGNKTRGKGQYMAPRYLND